MSGVARSLALFGLAALAEIGGSYLIWLGIREGRSGWLPIVGGLLLAAYGFIATLQSDHHFGRVLAAYGGVFVVGSMLWGMVFDRFRPDRYDVAGSLVCLVGVGLIMWSR